MSGRPLWVLKVTYPTSENISSAHRANNTKGCLLWVGPKVGKGYVAGQGYSVNNLPFGPYNLKDPRISGLSAVEKHVLWSCCQASVGEAQHSLLEAWEQEWHAFLHLSKNNSCPITGPWYRWSTMVYTRIPCVWIFASIAVMFTR